MAMTQPSPQSGPRLSMRTHGAMRGAADVELIDGFLWATGGYAYQVASVGETRRRL